MRRTLGDGAPVLLPPACFLRDQELSQKLLWEGMTIIQPWDMDDIAPEVRDSVSRRLNAFILMHRWGRSAGKGGRVGGVKRFAFARNMS